MNTNIMHLFLFDHYEPKLEIWLLETSEAKEEPPKMYLVSLRKEVIQAEVLASRDYRKGGILMLHTFSLRLLWKWITRLLAAKYCW